MKQNVVANNDTGHSVVGLKQLYAETVEELHRFAQMSSDGVVDEAEMDMAEEALLDFESHLLTRAASIPLRTDEDAHALMDIWAKLVGSKDGDEGERQSDKIAMNLFRHMTR